MSSPSGRPFPVVLLAGKRDGRVDPLAAAAGVSHKCLVPVAGVPLVSHALEALALCPDVSAIYVSTDDAGVIDAVPIARELQVAGRLAVVPAFGNLVDSVSAAIRACGAPALVTTADNALLTPAAVRAFAAAAAAEGADVMIGFARRHDVLAAHPEGQVRFYEFSDDAYSSCNLFWLANERSLAAAESFRAGGQFAKHPGRILGAFGAWNLLLFQLRLRDLSATLRALSRRFGLRIAPHVVKDGAVAIDVDNERTRRVAAELLELRAKRLRHA
jgi:GTP:adenosylcobinamide-phosphate guanylyltransferase